MYKETQNLKRAQLCSVQMPHGASCGNPHFHLHRLICFVTCSALCLFLLTQFSRLPLLSLLLSTPILRKRLYTKGGFLGEEDKLREQTSRGAAAEKLFYVSRKSVCFVCHVDNEGWMRSYVWFHFFFFYSIQNFQNRIIYSNAWIPKLSLNK